MSDTDIFVAPMMRAVTGIVAESEGAVSTLPVGFQGLVVSETEIPTYGLCMVIGVHRKDGSSTLCVIPPEQRDLLNDILANPGAAERGAGRA
ncbi:hypothetical protein GV829_04545 [Sphingomonas lacunae]|uniref:Uncharacterized protein n=1 Tax=Sphingomonas lacunae TaxID=2698828 RepID=A0A6M4ARW8_9SPHN|nr:hypothetical protein [Sphingomonas lacunae]QJQ31804.1 hypothetical protein GV829_04545 [Sphingomonas lacunae]